MMRLIIQTILILSAAVGFVTRAYAAPDVCAGRFVMDQGIDLGGTPFADPVRRPLISPAATTGSPLGSARQRHRERGAPHRCLRPRTRSDCASARAPALAFSSDSDRHGRVRARR
jgi:hypothetical protein